LASAAQRAEKPLLQGNFSAFTLHLSLPSQARKGDDVYDEDDDFIDDEDEVRTLDVPLSPAQKHAALRQLLF
jgi:hypothetical protein